MAHFNRENSHVQEESGAVIYHHSPEDLDNMDIRRQLKQLNTKLDLILSILNGGTCHGSEMERQGQCQNND